MDHQCARKEQPKEEKSLQKGLTWEVLHKRITLNSQSKSKQIKKLQTKLEEAKASWYPRKRRISTKGYKNKKQKM